MSKKNARILVIDDDREDFRETVLKPLRSVNKGYRDFDWERGSGDGFADAIESGINSITGSESLSSRSGLTAKYWLCGRCRTPATGNRH